MNSNELAHEVGRVVEQAQARITGIGADQYDMGDTQKFESMSLDELLACAQEETLDLVNYGVMLTILLERTREALAAKLEEERASVRATVAWGDPVYTIGRDEWPAGPALARGPFTIDDLRQYVDAPIPFINGDDPGEPDEWQPIGGGPDVHGARHSDWHPGETPSTIRAAGARVLEAFKGRLP